MWRMFAIHMGISALQTLLLDPKNYERVKPICKKIYDVIKAAFYDDPAFN
jgi:hypothetical protein